jgi:hypothetical protein
VAAFGFLGFFFLTSFCRSLFAITPPQEMPITAAYPARHGTANR